MARVVHFEIPADDPQRASTFFENVFGWKTQKWDGPIDYWMVMTGKPGSPGIDGGLLVKGQGNPMVVNTIDVDDLDAVIAKIESNGGTITAPKMAVPGVGWMAYFKDTEGNVHGIMQSDKGAS
jgi:uncharacterized protein